MDRQLIWNVTYNTDKILEGFDRILDIKNKLYEIPMPTLTIEEAYQLREELVNIQVLAEMTRADLLRNIDAPIKKTFLQKLLRK